jgi:hypothetical protein
MKMKTGTVKWFSFQKGYGCIHPDDARSLAPLEVEPSRQDDQSSNPGASGSTPTLDGRFTTKNAFDSISDLISSALWTRLGL